MTHLPRCALCVVLLAAAQADVSAVSATVLPLSAVRSFTIPATSWGRIAVDTTGAVYTFASTDPATAALAKYDTAGTLVATWPLAVHGSGAYWGFQYQTIATDGTQYVYVTSAGVDTQGTDYCVAVDKYTLQGTHIGTFGADTPCGKGEYGYRVAVGPDGAVYVAGSRCEGIMRWAQDGSGPSTIVPSICSTGPGVLDDVFVDGLAVDHAGNIALLLNSAYYVPGVPYTFVYATSVVVFDPTGTQLRCAVAPRIFAAPVFASGLTVDDAGHAYVNCAEGGLWRLEDDGTWTAVDGALGTAGDVKWGSECMLYAVVPGAGGQRSVVVSRADADADGLCDCWESPGEGLIVGTWPTRYRPAGADPQHKNCYVEVDAMVGMGPTQAVLDRVSAVFATFSNAQLAPPNPDGMNGIALTAQLSDVDVPRTAWGPDWAARYAAVRDEYFCRGEAPILRRAKSRIFRYCLFADSTSRNDTGATAIGGWEMMCTLGSNIRRRFVGEGPRDSVLAGTFMHELGHSLGLEHGGGDTVNYKPNYRSVMNYFWQGPIQRLKSYWRLGYSTRAFNLLNEFGPNEVAGIGGCPGMMTAIGPPGFCHRGLEIVPDTGAVDFDCDGLADKGTAGARDLSNLDGRSGLIQILMPYADVPLVRLGYGDGSGRISAGRPEMQLADANEMFATFVDRDGNGVADGDDIEREPGLDLDGDWVLDAFESNLGMSEEAERVAESLWCSPNPFSRETRIWFELRGAAMVRLEIVDVQGRRIAVLLDGVFEGGRHSSRWNGQLSSGGPAPAGVYLCRLVAGPFHAQRAMVLLP